LAGDAWMHAVIGQAFDAAALSVILAGSVRAGGQLLTGQRTRHGCWVLADPSLMRFVGRGFHGCRVPLHWRSTCMQRLIDRATLQRYGLYMGFCLGVFFLGLTKV